MSCLNWEQGYISVHYGNGNNSTLYELWGLPYPARQWYHDPLAKIEKFNKRWWELTVYRSHSSGEHTKHYYKTLKEAKAMGIAIVAVEGIKHD